MKQTIIRHSKILDSDYKYKESLKHLPLPNHLYMSRANTKPALSTIQLIETVCSFKLTEKMKSDIRKAYYGGNK